MSAKDFTIGHEPDRNALRERIAELEATVRVLRENEEKLHAEMADTVQRMALLGGHKAALLGVIEDAVETIGSAIEQDRMSLVMDSLDFLNSALRRYVA